VNDLLAPEPARVAPRTWRDYAAGGAYYTGAQALFERLAKSVEVVSREGGGRRLRRVEGSKYVILCYHRVGMGGVPLYSMQRARDFAAQMKYLREHYRVLSLGELLDELAEPDLRRQGVAVTFDDGYRDVYNHAWPILCRYGIPATIYLTAASIETGEVSWYDKVFLAFQCAPGEVLELDLDGRPSFALGTATERVTAAAKAISRMRRLEDSARIACCQELFCRIPLPAAGLADKMLTWEQCREMRRSGLDFGAHTMTHPVVSRLSPETLEAEVRQSKALIAERLGSEVVDFAYPFGQPADCGTDAPVRLPDWGFRSAVTTVQRNTTPSSNRYLLSRVQLAEVSLPLFALRLTQILSSAPVEPPREALASLGAQAKTSTASP
jgi:peptidoglycan/xylan/chitin deacetylase (PgdA/CDA1 family)